MDITSYLLGKKAGGGGGGTPNLQSKDISITTNGTQTVTADTGYDGLSDVDIATNVQPNLESKSVEITENTTTIITPTAGKDGLNSVEVITNVAGGGGGLPSEYQQVEYIQSSGTQYIITGLPIDQSTITEVEFAWVSDLGTWNYVFNVCQSNADGDWYGLGQASMNRGTRLNFGHTSTDNVYTNIAYDDFNKHHVVLQNWSVTVDGTNTFSVNSSTNFSTGTTPMTLFANNKGGLVREFSHSKIYSFKMYRYNVLMRDLVPCYRKSDGEIGMYDLVTEHFFTNDGTGTFLKGNDVNDNS